MDAIAAAAEERIVNERLRQKLNEVNSAAQSQLSSVRDHVNFTLQKAYFKCAYECFDRRRKNDELSNCVEHCSVPVLQAQNLVEGEMAKFQLPMIESKIKVSALSENSLMKTATNSEGVVQKERLNRALMVCQDKFEAAKLQQDRSEALNNLQSCVDQTVQDSINVLPPLVGRLKTALSVPE